MATKKEKVLYKNRRTVNRRKNERLLVVRKMKDFSRRKNRRTVNRKKIERLLNEQ